jgi:hypothetical protein
MDKSHEARKMMMMAKMMRTVITETMGWTKKSINKAKRMETVRLKMK